MRIKYVEELVGITKKNIRFYEEQGLLTPNRAENGYREYGQEDIERLKQIKLLRKLGVSIEDIGALLAGQLRLEECLDRHLDTLERQKERLGRMQALAGQMIERHETLRSLDTDSCLEQAEKMEKEGMHFMNVEKRDRQKKKLTGAIAAGAVFILLAVIIPVIVLLWVNTIDPIPTVVIIVYIVVSVSIGAAILAALIGRMKEIKGGEEDEASKY
ncbi:MAG: MerR family transcriptional regulator [Blautia sp.]|nr:MerR family transcriptional regulator [Blautia sp.]